MNTTKIEMGEGALTILYVGDPVGNGGPINVGACQGAELYYRKHVKLVECGQILGAINKFIIGEEATFKVRMLENTIRNYAIAMGLEPNDYDNRIIFGNERKAVFTSSLQASFIYTAVGQNTFLFEAYRATADCMLRLPFAKKDVRAFDVVFHLLARDSDGKIAAMRIL